MRRDPELKQKFLDEMSVTTQLLRVAFEVTNPTARRVLFKRVERRLFDEAQLLMKAGYPRLAEYIAILVASGALRRRGDDPPPALAVAMPIPPIGPPPSPSAMVMKLRLETEVAVLAMKHRRPLTVGGSGGSGQTPPSSLAVALVVPGLYGKHSIVLRGDARKKIDVA